MRIRFVVIALLLICSLVDGQPLPLTLEQSIKLAFKQGFAMQNASTQYQSSRENLEAELRRMRTSVALNFNLPTYNESLTNQFNPLSQRYEYYQIQTAEVQGAIVINQPLVFSGGNLTLRQQVLGRGQTSGPTSASHYSRDYFNNLQLQYRQPLLTPNTYRLTEERNRIALDQAQADFTRQQLDIVYTVTDAFYSAYQLQQRYDIIKEQVRQNEESFQTAQNKFNSGVVPEVDVLQSEVDLVTSRNDLLTAERDFSRAANSFRLLLGLQIDQPFSLVADPQFAPITVDQEEAVKRALAQRSEVLRAQRTVDLRQLDIESAEAKSNLRFDLTASYGINGTNAELTRLFDTYGVTRGAALSLSIPLFDWGSNALEIESARTLRQNAILSYENIQQQIRQEISDLVNRIRVAESRIHVLEKIVAVAQKGYDISLERFKSGTISRNDLAQSQSRLTNAKLSNLSALIDYQLALADLKRRTLWDFERNQPVRPSLEQ